MSVWKEMCNPLEAMSMTRQRHYSLHNSYQAQPSTHVTVSQSFWFTNNHSHGGLVKIQGAGLENSF